MNNKHLSKFLSLLLRHRPDLLNLQMNEQGWVDTEELIEKCQEDGKNIDLERLKEVVAQNDKKRFAFNEDGTKIRASQGHSIKIDLGYQPAIPPEMLYHGTTERNISSIRVSGLIKGKRNHVHLSKDMATAQIVGNRFGKAVILKVKAREMQQSGLIFSKSENGVWLTDHVPVSFIEFPEG